MPNACLVLCPVDNLLQQLSSQARVVASTLGADVADCTAFVHFPHNIAEPSGCHASKLTNQLQLPTAACAQATMHRVSVFTSCSWRANGFHSDCELHIKRQAGLVVQGCWPAALACCLWIAGRIMQQSVLASVHSLPDLLATIGEHLFRDPGSLHREQVAASTGSD